MQIWNRTNILFVMYIHSASIWIPSNVWKVCSIVFRTREGQCRNVVRPMADMGFLFPSGLCWVRGWDLLCCCLVVAFFWNQCVPMQRNNLNETSKYLPILIYLFNFFFHFINPFLFLLINTNQSLRYVQCKITSSM